MICGEERASSLRGFAELRGILYALGTPRE
jgi:hypothetical protein